MNNFVNIDYNLRSLTLQIFVDGESQVVVKHNGRDICRGTKEYCVDAIRNYMVFFDGGDKNIVFNIYDRTESSSGGDEGTHYLKRKLCMMASSCRARVQVNIRQNWQYA